MERKIRTITKKLEGGKLLKDLKIKLEWSTSNLLVWVILTMGIGLMIVNIVTMINMYFSYRNDVARDITGQRN